MLEIFLRQVLGYLVQVVPCAVLCFVPFTSSLRRPLKNVIAVCAATVAALCLVFSIIGSMPLPEEVAHYRYVIQNIVFMLMLTVLCTLYVRLINAGTGKKIFVFLFVASYGSLMSLIQSSLNVPLGIADVGDGYMYHWTYLTLLAVINGVFFAPAYLLMKQFGSRMDSSLPDRLWKQMCVVPALLISAVLMGNLIPMQLEDNFNPSGETNALFSAFVIVTMLVLCAWILLIIDGAQRDAIERNHLEAMMESHKRAADEAKRIRKLRHDMHHHLQAASSYIDRKQYDEAKNYLQLVGRELEGSPAARIYAANDLLNTMLQQYADTAHRKNIAFSCAIEAPEHLGISDIELVSLVSNILDNAIEGASNASSAMEGEAKPSLSFRVLKEGDFLYFLCENTCDEKALRRTRGGFLSTKKSGRRGIGTSIIADIAEKHGGTCRLDASDGVFHTQVSLNSEPQ